MQFDIETKVFPHRPNDTVAPEVFVDTLLAAIRAAGMTQRVMIQSFDWRTLALVQRLEPGLRTVYLTIESRNSQQRPGPGVDGGPDGARLRVGAATWSRPPAARSGHRTSTTSTPSSAQRAHDLGLQLVPWTVNEPADMRRLIDWGVDGIITDYPDRLREVMRERGLALPPGVSR